MKDILKNINKLFDHRVRLGIMSALMVNETLDFTALQQQELIQHLEQAGKLAKALNIPLDELTAMLNKYS